MADFDLPLILVIASAIGIVVYLLDFFILKAKRLQTAEMIDKTIVGYQETYQQALAPSRFVAEVKSFLPIILAVLIIRSFIIEPFQIPSSSMEPSLQIGDFILVNKFTYGLRLPVTNTEIISVNKPKRGEVMVFFPPNDPRYFIKRVIGLPGDYIEYKDKKLYVNGLLQEQTPLENTLAFDPRAHFAENLDGVTHSIFTDSHRLAQDGAFVVRDGHYFMMGDNRDNSSDSRVWGQVPEENIVGKAFFIWMHWKSWRSLPSFQRVGTIQ